MHLEDLSRAEEHMSVQRAAQVIKAMNHSGFFPLLLFQPLTMRRQEHEKRRKEIKEQWQRAKRKLVGNEQLQHAMGFRRDRIPGCDNPTTHTSCQAHCQIPCPS